MSCNGITLIQNDKPIVIQQAPEAITLIQELEVIEVCAQNPVAQFLPFYFDAIQDQTVFTLPAIALSVPLCAINGTAQSQAKTPTPDFTVVDNVLTLSEGVDAGDLVFGVIQVA